MILLLYASHVFMLSATSGRVFAKADLLFAGWCATTSMSSIVGNTMLGQVGKHVYPEKKIVQFQFVYKHPSIAISATSRASKKIHTHSDSYGVQIDIVSSIAVGKIGNESPKGPLRRPN